VAEVAKGGEMNRMLSVGLVATGLIGGYLVGGSGVEAQSTMSSRFPFTAGDTISLVFRIPGENPAGETCVIESFRETYVVCKTENDVPIAYNLEKAFRVTRVAKASR
jgi:hypothetical protein